MGLVGVASHSSLQPSFNAVGACRTDVCTCVTFKHVAQHELFASRVICDAWIFFTHREDWKLLSELSTHRDGGRRSNPGSQMHKGVESRPCGKAPLPIAIGRLAAVAFSSQPCCKAIGLEAGRGVPKHFPL